MTQVYEINFDGLVGPTHHYAGLAYGNVASLSNAQRESNPKQAALQGLAKMRLLDTLGIKQGILLPHARPADFVLRQLGFQGDEQSTLEHLAKHHPRIFTAIFSASSMWTANAATITPSSDSADQKCHVTPANLSGQFHRAIEAAFTHKQLQAIFQGDKFIVHSPLPYGMQFGDEGAANHTRLCRSHNAPGLHIYAYGRNAFDAKQTLPQKFPARQTLQASEAIARTHTLATKPLFLKQNPKAIDEGVFHNDVIAVGNENVFLVHESAYENKQAIADIQQQVDFDLHVIIVSENELSVHDAVQTYLFNSQLVTLPDKTMTLILPTESEQNPQAHQIVERILAEDNPIERAEFIDCRQSMRNGGGPACLRLRAVVSEEEIKDVNPRFLMNEHTLGLLEVWVQKYYRDRLTQENFLDKGFRDSCAQALDELAQLLDLPDLYN